MCNKKSLTCLLTNHVHDQGNHWTRIITTTFVHVIRVLHFKIQHNEKY